MFQDSLKYNDKTKNSIIKNNIMCATVRCEDSLEEEELSWRATTNFDLCLSPSKKVTTRLLTSSVLLELKENSSCLMVARVKVPPLKQQSSQIISMTRNHS